MAELKSCPFCGGEAEIWEDKVFCTYVPQCKECNAQRGRYINKENAIEAWNTRKPMDAAVAELMELRDRGVYSECYRDREELSCALGSACRDCYEEKVREILQIERKG